MPEFFKRHLDPATRLGELLFGLIMALGVTGAVRLGLTDASNRELFIAVMGCNIAWGIVDGVMFVILALFERGRKDRIVDGVLSAANDDEALKIIQCDLSDRLEPVLNAAECSQIYHWVLESARRTERERPQIQRQDILGGIAVALLILLATLPIVAPFILLTNPTTAVRISNTITVVMLFGIGWKWGRIVGANPVHFGTGVAAVGLTLVLITIALGG